MKTERGISNGNNTALKERIAGTLATLALLKNQLEGVEGAESIVASLQGIRAKTIKAYPILIWQSPVTTFEAPKETQLLPALPLPTPPGLGEQEKDIEKPKEVDLQEELAEQEIQEIAKLPEIDELPAEIETEKELPELDIETLALEGDELDPKDEEMIGELPEPDMEALIPEGDDDLDPDEEELVEELQEEVFETGFMDSSDDVPESESILTQGRTHIRHKTTRKNSDDEEMIDMTALGLHLKEIGQIPMQRENHSRWGEEVFAGNISLQALSLLSQSELLTPSQEERVLQALKKGNFLLERFDSRIKVIKKRLEANAYGDDIEKAERSRELDIEFMKTVSENEELVNEVPGIARGIEDEDEKSMFIEQSIQRRINFVNQGREAWENLVKTNLRLAFNIAKRYQYSTIPLVELAHYGYEGLMVAAANYDPRMGFQFSTYATWWIRQTISRAVHDYGSMIRLPVGIHDQIRNARKAQEHDLDEDGRQSDDLPENLRNAYKVLNVLSLDQPITEDGKRTLGDIIPTDLVDQTLEEAAEQTSVNDAIREVLTCLTDKQSTVLELRFGLTDGRARTLEEVAREFGVTRERIRQIETIALRKLRHPSRSRKLRSFLG